jgi:hypothetical protein
MIYFPGINGKPFWKCQLSRQRTGKIESDNVAHCTINVPRCINWTGNKSHQEKSHMLNSIPGKMDKCQRKKNNPKKTLPQILLRPITLIYLLTVSFVCEFSVKIYRDFL